MFDVIYGDGYIASMKIGAEQFFTALGSDIRLRCLLLLEQEGELCVCELTHALNESQPKISRHLAHLREWGLVLDHREGLWIHYRLHPELPKWATEVLHTSRIGLQDSSPYTTDRQRLTEMPNRPAIRCCA
jgi:ArsR family transcriptional regulator, arsenate/arsenite/antimonite-responsive transcriptional repressor